MTAGAWPAGGVVVITGPTGVGKTALGLAAARALGAEIISADSRQIYEGLDVGTGKPSRDDLRQVRHHLVSRMPPARTVTAADFAVLAETACREIESRGARCLVVGGTGLWLRAFIDGLEPTPPPDPRLRHDLAAREQREGLAALHDELRRLNPAAAERIQPADRVRVVRALEIALSPPGAPAAPIAPARPSAWFGLTRPRAEVYRRAEERIDAWLAAGWLEEVKGLIRRGVPEEAPAMQALGYAHLVRFIRGDFPWDETVRQIKRDTRRYVKRQGTWFNADPRVTWIDADLGEDAIVERMLAGLRERGWVV